jgi:hypothetical protein
MLGPISRGEKMTLEYYAAEANAILAEHHYPPYLPEAWQHFIDQGMTPRQAAEAELAAIQRQWTED